jgi:glycosyltransferase involved in cell wall biosynthesis
MKVYGILFRPVGWVARSGLWPVVEAAGMVPVEFGRRWQRWQLEKSWTAGTWLRRWGNRWYGSGWNSLTPFWDERAIRSALPDGEPHVTHWLWGEFAAPKRADAYRRRGARVVVSVHCSARRWDDIWMRPDGYTQADIVVLTSETQRPFVERTVPRDRVRRIPLGVDCRFFSPEPGTRTPGKRLRLFLFGNTERNHAFAALVAKRLPADRFELRVRTDTAVQGQYDGIPCVSVLPELTDGQVLEEYRRADITFMPMLDSAANDVFLESMACGTPLMVNRVGGVPEYVSEACNFVMPPDSAPDDWADRLLSLERDRAPLHAARAPARVWAERFDWTKIAEDYRALYRELEI